MSTLGLDGVLPWPQARHIAGTCARALPMVQARLDEAAGSLLAQPLTMLQDDPPADAAAVTGYAVCGEAPWQRIPDDALRPGTCAFVHADDPLPRHTDAVLAHEDAVVEESVGGTAFVIALDPLTGLPDESTRPTLGTGIARQGTRAAAGASLVPADRVVTSATIALAAAAGYDELPIFRPPVVGTLVLGSALLSSGLPRRGRVRDALGDAIPSFVGALGARGNPAVRAPDTRELLLAEIDDANVDVLITTGSTAPGPDNHVRQALRDLGARWLIDGVASTPGAQMLLAKLPDGRFLVGLPGHPESALAALMTLVTPLITTLRGAVPPEPRTAALVDDAPAPEYADDTTLVPVALDAAGAGTIARPLADGGPGGVRGWANADALAVIPPGAGLRGDVVEVLPLPELG